MILRTLLFTDVVGSTAWVQNAGDERALSLWAEHDRCARHVLALHGGIEIDRTDGFFLLFQHAGEAAHFAVAYHALLHAMGITARVGLHQGMVTLRHNPAVDVARGAKAIEVEGLAKPLAARIMSLARGGQTLLTAHTAAAMRDALPPCSALQLCGHYHLKGLEDPVEVFELAQAGREFEPPADTEKAYRVVRLGDLWQPLRSVPHNLPAERDVFIGRGTELRRLANELDAGARFITVLGPGGTGKTRFVRRYALSWLGEWPGGAWFCDLSEARSLDGIYFAVALALGVPIGSGDPAVQLGHAIAARGRCLIILDNFEQVMAHAGESLGGWLDRATQASFVVTSRERLHLCGEHTFPIDPLPLDSEAIELFVARARMHRPPFMLDAGNRESVAELVKLLDGLPLAIELAAARVRVLSPAQILSRLRDRFALLADDHAAATRQSTLRAAIDWSWELLTGWEQAVLAQCSVFEGGFTLDAAEAVLEPGAWPGASSVMNTLQALVDKSLLRAWLPKASGRLELAEPYFGMYLTIQEYAAQKLDASGPQSTTRAQRRHGQFFARLGTQEALDALVTHDGGKRRQLLTLELDNLVAACRRALARDDAVVAVATFRAAEEVLTMRGPFNAGATLGKGVLALPNLSDPLAIDAATSQAHTLYRMGRLVESRAMLERTLVRALDCGDRRREGVVRTQLAGVDREQGRLHEARQQLEAALPIHREAGNRHGEGMTRLQLGNVCDQLGMPDSSRQSHEAALAIFNEDGNRHGVGLVRASLGILSRHQGRFQESLAHYEAALAIHREEGDLRSEGVAMGNMANALGDMGLTEESQRFHEGALALHRQVGSRVVEAFALANLGLAHKQHKRWTEARDCLTQALAISREVKNLIHEGVVLNNLGSLELAEGRFEQARAFLEEALKRHREVGNRAYVGTTIALLAKLRNLQAQPAEALAMLVDGESVLREIDNPIELAGLLCVKGAAALAVGDRDAARCALDEAELIAGRLTASGTSRLADELDKLRQAVGEPPHDMATDASTSQ